MTDALDRLLRLVAEGRLSAEEAGPILAALDQRPRSGFQGGASGSEAGAATPSEPSSNPRWARIEVRESGRRVVDLRVPMSLGPFALARVPGLSKEQISDVEDAALSGARGPILDVEDPDGDGVRIVLEEPGTSPERVRERRNIETRARHERGSSVFSVAKR